jgi:catechol 2,3-dioxygenase
MEENMAPARKPRPVIAPRLHHTTFLTLKLDEMVAWYEKVAGLTTVHYSEPWGVTS